MKEDNTIKCLKHEGTSIYLYVLTVCAVWPDIARYSNNIHRKISVLELNTVPAHVGQPQWHCCVQVGTGRG